jgi:hypothetical protein
MRRFLTVVLAAATTVAAACTGEDPDLAAATPDASTADTSAPSVPDASTTDAGAEAGFDAGCDATLATDPKNCGSCGRDCGQGAECKAGVCQPALLASKLSAPVSIAVNDQAFFVLNAGGGVGADSANVVSCPVTGCGTAPNIVVQGFDTAKYAPGPRMIHATTTDFYWVYRNSFSDHYIGRCNAAGCPNRQPPQTPFYDGQGEWLGQLYGTTSHLVFVQRNSAVLRTPIPVPAVAGVAYLFTDSGVEFAMDDEFVYSADRSNAVDYGGLFRCPVGGCASSADVVKLLPSTTHVEVANKTLYATLEKSKRLVACDRLGCGGLGTTLATSPSTILAVAADDVGVYFLTKVEAGDPGSVFMCKLPDCKGGPVALATGVSAGESIAVRNGFVYWVDRGTADPPTGTVHRVRR